MKRALVFSISAWLGLASLGASCSGGGGPASPPLDPFGSEPASASGTEPAGTDNEAPATTGGSIEELCAAVCQRIETECSQMNGGTNCASDCATSDTQGCASQFKAFVSCLTTAPLSCADGMLTAPSCDGASLAFETCARGADSMAASP